VASFVKGNWLTFAGHPRVYDDIDDALAQTRQQFGPGQLPVYERLIVEARMTLRSEAASTVQKVPSSPPRTSELPCGDLLDAFRSPFQEESGELKGLDGDALVVA
jgi:hypothetical protein